jgi:hypothetical protein
MIKGGRPPFFKSTKNVIRNIRYRMAVRKRIRDEQSAAAEGSGQVVVRPSRRPQSWSSPVELTEDVDGTDRIFREYLMRDSAWAERDGSANAPADTDDLPARIAEAAAACNCIFEMGTVELDYSSEADLIESMERAAGGVEHHLATSQSANTEAATAADDGAAAAGSVKPSVIKYLPGVYRRCCKVWLKLVSYFAKNFMWEVDKETYPDYFDVIKRPLSLSAIAYKLTQMAYGAPTSRSKRLGGNSADGDSASSSRALVNRVASAFYHDIRTVCLNCVTFTSESSAIVAQAQHMLEVVQRHLLRWVLFPSSDLEQHAVRRPAVEQCDESHCLFSLHPIPVHRSVPGFGPLGHTSITCGKCSGVFSLAALHSAFSKSEEGDAAQAAASVDAPDNESSGAVVRGILDDVVDSVESKTDGASPADVFAPYFIAPTDELIAQSGEEWVCMFCLREDTFVYREDRSLRSDPRSSFAIDEWGVSSALPWSLHPGVSAAASVFTAAHPVHGGIGFAASANVIESGDSFRVVSDNRVAEVTGAILRSVVGLPPQVLVLQNAAMVASNPLISPLLPQYDGVYHTPMQTENTWSVSNRLVALRGLCELIRLNPDAHECMSAIHHECSKLAKMSSQAPGSTNMPVEAAFVAQCRAVAGEEAVQLYRRSMDGLYKDKFGASGDYSEVADDDLYAQNVVITGRCALCKGSTFSEDCPDDQVLLCDGCNVEAHLKCLELDAV